MPNRKSIVLRDITIEELESFWNELTTEKKYLTNPLSRNHQFLVALRQNSEIAAVGGLKRYFIIFHFSFFVVKNEFQRKGFGSAIKVELFKYARSKHYAAIFAVVNPENAASLQTNYDLGYKTVYKSDSQYILAFPLNPFGKVLIKIMPIMSIFISFYFLKDKILGKKEARENAI